MNVLLIFGLKRVFFKSTRKRKNDEYIFQQDYNCVWQMIAKYLKDLQFLASEFPEEIRDL